MSMRVLISGASVAGPVLAYWLTAYGFEVTVVERAPTLRKTGGHAVDLFRPAMQIVTKMGLLEQIRGKATGTETLVIHRAEGSRPPLTSARFTRPYQTTTSRSCATTSARSSTTRRATTSNTCSPTPSRRSLTTARSRLSMTRHADST
jgi:2-polyprenyl-6-methoxyphenol hydroxylase-like FAD-dependent oxidoreductase